MPYVGEGSSRESFVDLPDPRAGSRLGAPPARGCGCTARPRPASTALGPQLRAYIVSTFPNFLTDWSLTFLGSGIEVGIKQLQAQLSA